MDNVNTTPTKTFKRIDISPKTKDLICIECGDEVADCNKRRKLFIGSTKTESCKNLERIIGKEFDAENCLSNIACRNCVEKNTKLLCKLNSVRDRFNTVEATLTEKIGKLITKRQVSEKLETQQESASSSGKLNSAKRRVVFTAPEPVPCNLSDSNHEIPTETNQFGNASSVTVRYTLLT